MAIEIDPELFEVIYDIPLGVTDWDDVVQRLRRQFHDDLGTLTAYGPGGEDVQSFSLCGRDESVWTRYAEEFAAIDPLRAAMSAGLIRSGEVVGNSRLLRWRSFRNTDFYNVFWREQDFGFCAVGHFRDADGRWLQLGLTRSAGEPDYTDEELRLLAIYFDHLSQAYRLRREVDSRSGRPNLDAIARGYGLTPAETKLVECLMEHGSLRRAADRLRRSYNTVRAQLRSVFEKTGARSQLELMAISHRSRDAL